MAEINNMPARRKKTLSPALKKKFPRVDLTPMVDLGFLLITFFMFATTLSEPHAMKLTVPKPCPGCDITVAQEKGLVLILDKNNLVYSYEAMDPEHSFRINSFGAINEFRNMIAEKKAKTRLLLPNDPGLVISIKNTPEATNGNFVDLMDEIKINDAGIPVTDQLTDTERQMIAKIL